MPSFRDMKKFYSNVGTLGQQIKESSDYLMEQTWDNDLQSKVCYIYDYWHDDQPDKTDHITHENTIKTRIDAKFIVKSYQSIDKDQVEYYLQFKPSQKVEFESKDDLYYFETDYRRKYGNQEFPLGMYVDIPDDRGNYRKWMICSIERANQFPKYLILPINYRLMWIERSNGKRIKRRMWACLRQQSSYNSGLWTDLRFTSQENQDKIWLPLNSITENIWYTDDESKNMRVLVGAFTDHPISWKISKVENAQPIGIQKLCIYQDFFDRHRDYIERDEDGNIIGMWANYYDSEMIPEEPVELQPDSKDHTYHAEITASTSTIKVGGSYKLLTMKIYDGDKVEDENKYSSTFSWTCNIDDVDYTSQVTWLEQPSNNQIKIKLPKDRLIINKILKVKAVSGNLSAEITFRISA